MIGYFSQKVDCCVHIQKLKHTHLSRDWFILFLKQPEDVYILLSGSVYAFLPDSKRDQESRRPAVDVYGRADIFGAMEPILKTARCFTTTCVGFVETGRLALSDFKHLLVSF